MDNRTFISKLARNSGMSIRVTAAVAQSLVDKISDALVANNEVALPGFGTLGCEKCDEKVVTDSDGRRSLMPPSINVVFMPGSRLRKKYKQK